MKSSIVVELPMPPHGRCLDERESLEIRSWLEAAGRQVMAKAPSAIHGNVAIKILASVPSKLSELGRIAHPIVGLLEAQELITKCSVSDLFMRWDRSIPDGCVRVEFGPTRPPQFRTGAATRAKVAKMSSERWARARAEKAATEGRTLDG